MWEFFVNRHENRVNGGSSNIVNKVEINGVWKHPAIWTDLESMEWVGMSKTYWHKDWFNQMSQEHIGEH